MREVVALENLRTRGRALTVNKAGPVAVAWGDYRVKAAIVDTCVVVVVADVGHWSRVYD